MSATLSQSMALTTHAPSNWLCVYGVAESICDIRYIISMCIDTSTDRPHCCCCCCCCCSDVTALSWQQPCRPTGTQIGYGWKLGFVGRCFSS